MHHRNHTVPFFAAIVLLGSAGGICRGAPIAISNHSFEAPVVASGSSNTVVTNWQDIGAAGDNGVFRGDGDFGQLAAPTNGSQMAFMNDLTTAALVQTLATTYQTGLDYELKVDIAARATVAAGHGATLYLFKGSIATLADLTAANTVASFVVDSTHGFTADVFNTFTLTATAAQVAAVGGVGQSIGIAIRGRVGSGQNQDLDNVRLATVTNDTDGDTLPDTWELAQTGVTSLNALTNAGSGTPPGTGTGDYDGDGLADLAELSKGTDAGRADSDSDSLNDGPEVSGAQNPYQAGHLPGKPPGGTPGAPTLPTSNDSDGDGILDGEEVVAGSDGFVTNPNAANTDGDSANDAEEVAAGTNPTVPDGPQVYTPLQLNFKKDYQVRNYFNSSLRVGGLDLTQDVLAGTAHPRIHLTSPGCTFSQNGTVLQISNPTATSQESLISLGKINNYTAIDLDLSGQTHTTGTATALLSLYQNASNRIDISQRDIDSANKAISLTIIKNGTTVVANQTLSANGIAAPNTLRMHLTGVYLNFLTVQNGGAPVHLATIDIGTHFDLRTKTLLDSFTLAAGARLASGESVSITRLENFLTSGTAQADPRVIHYENGAPMVEGNTIWVAMTTRGYGPIPSSYQSIYSYDLVTKAWKIASVLAFDNGDGKLRQWCAGDVLFDRTDQKWKVFVVSHGDDQKIYYGESTADLRTGHHRIAASLMNYASNSSNEDASVIYDEDAGKWRMAMCRNSGGFQTVLFESAGANGAWSQIGIYTPTSSTGILIQKIGGQRYVFLGRGASPCPMEVLSYPGMVKLGELNLNVKPVGHNIWPVIIPLTYTSGTKYHLLTFDRDNLFGGWSYGNLHWYEADEFAGEFLEFENEIINPDGNYTSWIGGYDVGTETGFTVDPDGDGLRNGVEAFFGTAPGVSNGGLTEISKAANTLTFRHPNPAIPLSDVTGSYEWSPDMNTWYAADGVAGDGNFTVTAVATPNNPTTNTTTVVATLVGTVPSRMFIRVAARTP